MESVLIAVARLAGQEKPFFHILELGITCHPQLPMRSYIKHLFLPGQDTHRQAQISLNYYTLEKRIILFLVTPYSKYTRFPLSNVIFHEDAIVCIEVFQSVAQSAAPYLVMGL